MTVPSNAAPPLSNEGVQNRDGYSSTDMIALSRSRESERFALHSKHLNEMWVRVLKTIGYDVGFTRGVGSYLYDRAGDRYLDLLSGWGVFALGRNHPKIRDALINVIAGDLPNLVQLDVSVLAGVLAEMLLKRAPWLDKAFFANSAPNPSRRRSSSRVTPPGVPPSRTARTHSMVSPVARCR